MVTKENQLVRTHRLLLNQLGPDNNESNEMEKVRKISLEIIDGSQPGTPRDDNLSSSSDKKSTYLLLLDLIV